ncbi:MAG: bifunctional orotidine-5'-phosphate decarboxylase/orotate phosphoribosyltransferase [Drouetiella hepatica Uher 2000/2452]|jgi:uridine monophosphate synthetase|uniref:Orotate phosphoribosyltransferase n=1 Tax=Drouetiella hepatica Uher 2000/2452 TaxID=904376 RepID=A0A951QC98_9CYAN|nr:bifunctional orotidine-5'-phosphate decarboxylase/orotate phosphoribosyltransferase [Drouetiella hepatica Uher 2000/2452]
MHFSNKLEATISRNSSLLIVGLDPNPEMMPAGYGDRSSQDALIESLRAWLQWTIAQTKDLVCAYKPTLGFYQALGSAGMELLQDILHSIPSHIPVILDAKHSDLNTSSLIAQTVFIEWQVDAITLSAYPGQDLVAPFLVYPGKAVFVLCRTANASAAKLQEDPTSESPFYLHVVQESKNWGTTDQLGLEIGTTTPDVLEKVRAIAPERLILVRSIWQEEVSLPQILAAGLNHNGEGLLIPIPQDWMSQENLAEQVRSLREQVNQVRTQTVQENLSCDVWFSNVCTLKQHPHLDLILQLYDVGCILFGDFVQASGATFPYYIDLRKIISNPQLFQQVLSAYAEILKDLSFDRIAGIPYGALPTATGLALQMNRPMIFPRKEVKAHGTRRMVEGNFEPGETAVVVDDILISGNSAMEGAAKLQSVGLKVLDIVVFLDHEQDVKDRLRTNGYQPHSVLTISEVIETLQQAGRISEAEMGRFKSEMH